MSEVVAEFIYKTSNPIIKERARETGHSAYISSFNSKADIPEWKTKFENVMTNYTGTKFSFEQLENWILIDAIQPRYMDISWALYKSLKPHYANQD